MHGVDLTSQRGEIVGFLATHYIDGTDTLSDRIPIIDQGEIVIKGILAALKKPISKP